MTFASWYARMERRRVRWEFNAERRTDFYEQITQLHGNGIALEEALRRIYLVAADGKEKPTDAVAIISQELYRGVAAGNTFSALLGAWVPEGEVSLIAAGEAGGDLLAAFERIVVSMERRKRLVAGVVVPLVLPMTLALLIYGLLFFNAFFFAPQLLQMQPLEKWKGLTRVLLDTSVFFKHWWWAISALVVAGVVLFTASLSRWTGPTRDWYAVAQQAKADSSFRLPMPMRSKVDRFPPYSIYRIYQASMFLNSLVQMQGQGISAQAALETLRRFSSPWLRERIADTLWSVAGGEPLGVALEKAGHEFPDKMTIQFVKTLEANDPTGKALDTFLERWINRNIKQVGKQAMVLRMIALTAAALMLLLFYGGIYGIQQMSQSR